MTGSGVLGGDDLDDANLIEGNATAVSSFVGPIQFNRIARNAVGIAAITGQQIVHNLIYRNTSRGVLADGVSDVRIFSNTFYAPSGDNIRVQGGASRVEVRNNILWAESGYDLYVAYDSQSGFFSDYNDLFASGTGRVGYWTKDFVDVLDWQADVARFDLHSIGGTLVNPRWAEPRFVDRVQDDYRIDASSMRKLSSLPSRSRPCVPMPKSGCRVPPPEPVPGALSATSRWRTRPTPSWLPAGPTSSRSGGRIWSIPPSP